MKDPDPERHIRPKYTKIRALKELRMKISSRGAPACLRAGLKRIRRGGRFEGAPGNVITGG